MNRLLDYSVMTPDGIQTFPMVKYERGQAVQTHYRAILLPPDSEVVELAAYCGMLPVDFSNMAQDMIYASTLAVDAPFMSWDIESQQMRVLNKYPIENIHQTRNEVGTLCWEVCCQDYSYKFEVIAGREKYEASALDGAVSGPHSNGL